MGQERPKDGQTVVAKSKSVFLLGVGWSREGVF